ncbi:hypothetical protein K2X89_14785 [Myxococcota bacterium]|nr:hypothetical protein [Myxococcota bacterium]
MAMPVLREPDALPASDLGLRQAITPKDEAATHPADEVESLLEPARPYRAYAEIRLWSLSGSLAREPARDRAREPEGEPD